jgi:3-oxoacyl-[acyl-carrier protein] reductase
MDRLIGKTCVVTGGAQGIGRAIALAFAGEGARVAILDRNNQALQGTVTELKRLDDRSLGLVADVADEQAVSSAFEQIQNALGPVDALVNNAGVMSYATVATMSVHMWDEMMAINLRSMFLCSRAVLPSMQGRRWGRIVNLSSQLAHKGALELAHYAASKAGVLGFTRSLAREVIGFGINVNAICPGPIDTELSRTNSAEWRAQLTSEMPIKRYGEVEEIAPTAVLLASEEASFYVGASFNPNGGDVMI